jgi:O-antigen ligase
VLAEWAPWRLRLCYLVALASTVAAGGLVQRIPEQERLGRQRWRIQWPQVPRGIRVEFARVALTGAIVWAVVALYLSIVPSYAGDLLATGNLALLAAVSAVALSRSGSLCRRSVSRGSCSPPRCTRSRSSSQALCSPEAATAWDSSTPRIS